MKLSRKGWLFLLELEAVVLTPYKDSKGIWTVGVGHTAAAGRPYPQEVKSLTLGEAFDLFTSDLNKYQAAVASALKVPVKQHQFDALVSFHFNTGAIKKAALTAWINKGDLTRAGNAFLNWTKPPEIIGRRRAEMKLFTTGNYQEPFQALVYQRKPGKPSVLTLKG